MGMFTFTSWFINFQVFPAQFTDFLCLTPLGLTMHATILAYMFSLVEQNKIGAPLFNPATVQAANNAIYVQEYVAQLLKQAFPHMQE